MDNELAVKENDLIINMDLRKSMLSKVEVLEKVKELILLPNTELMTTSMVAEWYEVGIEAIKSLYSRNRGELELNGTKTTKGTELQQLKTEVQTATLLGKANAVTIYSKRALLNVGMLLSESKIAQRVRTTLLDQQEVTTEEQKTIHIDQEKELALNIMFAESEEEKMMAFNSYRQYKNRYITELETQIEEQTPKVESFDMFINGQNYKKMNNVAKSLGYGRNKLYEFLRENKVLMKDNLPYQKYINLRYFVVKENPINKGNFVKNHSQTYVSAKGIDFINKLLSDNKITRVN